VLTAARSADATAWGATKGRTGRTRSPPAGADHSTVVEKHVRPAATPSGRRGREARGAPAPRAEQGVAGCVAARFAPSERARGRGGDHVNGYQHFSGLPRPRGATREGRLRGGTDPPRTLCPALLPHFTFGGRRSSGLPWFPRSRRPRGEIRARGGGAALRQQRVHSAFAGRPHLRYSVACCRRRPGARIALRHGVLGRARHVARATAPRGACSRGINRPHGLLCEFGVAAGSWERARERGRRPRGSC
jgi:hypothetical protein